MLDRNTCPISALATLLVTGTLLAAPPSDAIVGRQTPRVQPAVTIPEVAQPRPPAKKSPEEPAVDIDVGPAPVWIWAGSAKRLLFRKDFTLPAEIVAARLVATCDNELTVFLNGQQVASNRQWERPIEMDVRRFLRAGRNELRVDARNADGPAGLLLKLVVRDADGRQHVVVTDKTWQAFPLRGRQVAAKPVPVRQLGKLGTQPWGDVFAQRQSVALNLRTPPEVFEVRPGFQVELLYTVPKDTQGSWVSLTFDPQGRLIASDQGDKGLYRITPPPVGKPGETLVEKVPADISSAQGLCFAFGALYVSVNGRGSGFYRVTDSDGDDRLDKVELLKPFRGAGEHGPHSIRLSPDGKSLFVIAGNHTELPENFTSSRIPTNWGEDFLLTRFWDARGHARGRLAPGGWICRTDPEGKTWEVYSIGYRNAFDMDFNADGELFAYDADMEWDMGMPWYRPTRVVHATDGSEFGWRSGTGKWPPYFPDSLPPVLDIGPGSPVGVTFGYGLRFPARYQKALFLLDWTFGTIYTVHLEPQGASYRGTLEEFLSRSPLPLTDAAVGPDGALYFAIGGRGTQSALYRVTYTGDASTAPVDAHDTRGADLRALRHKLEALHRPADDPAAVVATVWPYLGHEDRFIRYAARIALEFQPVDLWAPRVFSETDAQTLVTAAVALARQGKPIHQQPLLDALDGIDLGAYPEQLQLELLRAYALTFIRLGRPPAQRAQQLAKKLDALYPGASDWVNRELCRLLVYLDSPTVVAKTLPLMRKRHDNHRVFSKDLIARNTRYGGAIAQMLANTPDEQQIHYAFMLMNVKYGWTLEQRREYFAWFEKAARWSGGASFAGFLKNIRDYAYNNMTDAEKKALAAVVDQPLIKQEELPKPIGPGRDWTVEELVQLASSRLKDRDFEAGRRAYRAAKCILCHRFAGEGGATGPDLTNVAGRFGIRDLAEALIEPSKVISDQYRAMVLVTASGKTYTGRILNDDGKKLTVLIDPIDATKIVEIDKSDIEAMQPSPVSLMPKDLLDPLNEDEVLDLLAYLLSRGNPQAPYFRQ